MRDLSLLLDFDAQYRRDGEQDAAFLHRRDRKLAATLDADAPGFVGAWLAAVDPEPRDGHGADPRLRFWRRLRWLFVAAGLLLGVVAMLGLLYYDAGRRISVTLMLGAVALQALLALATSAQALIGWRPWHGLYDGDPPRWLAAGGRPDSMLRALEPQLGARVAHSGGLAFAAAALLTLLTQVVVHDLAFGWSTTLQASAPAFHALTSALAWPWHAVVPQAVPSLELIEQSRYFRLGTRPVADPALLGNWWRFLAMLWLVYALLLRAVLLAFSRWHLRHRARRLLARHPGLAALRERCRTPWLEHGADNTPANAPLPTTAAPAPAPPWPHAATLIAWADAPALHASAAPAPAHALAAGGHNSLADDQACIEAAARTEGTLLITTRAWEPPTGELADFLADARAHLGARPILLLPLAADGQPAAEQAVLAQWQRFVARCQDPHLALAGATSTETA